MVSTERCGAVSGRDAAAEFPVTEFSLTMPLAGWTSREADGSVTLRLLVLRLRIPKEKRDRRWQAVGSLEARRNNMLYRVVTIVVQQ